ncbi:MAG: site-2 protease family protein [Tepidisphaeraceae bacterium]
MNGTEFMDFSFLSSVPNIILLALGFGFVIFFHELGHFLAAKWADVKVEQFAVGFGQAILSWRKGLGVRWGSSTAEYEQLRNGERSAPPGVDPRKLGETEYRLNWLPLGGYVKMLGQDDLRPNSAVDDPRAYNARPIGKRMVIVSAGVVMNIILAAIGFCILFLVGFNAPPAVVGSVQPDSPAQKAGLGVGDQILFFNGKYQHDFTKIVLNVALVEDGVSVPVVVRTPQGQEKQISIRPSRADPSSSGMFSLGISQSRELRGLDPAKLDKLDRFDPALYPPGADAVRPGEVIISVNGTAIDAEKLEYKTRYYVLDEALQRSDGKPIELKLRDDSGQVRQASVQPIFMKPFGADELAIAGMRLRARVDSLQPDSRALNILLPEDVILRTRVEGGAEQLNPTGEQLRAELNNAGQSDRSVDVTVLRGGEMKEIKGLHPTLRLGGSRVGLGLALGVDEQNAVVAEVVADSSAGRAGIPVGSAIVSIDGQPVQTWHDARRILRGMSANKPIAVQVRKLDGQPADFQMVLTKDDLEQIGSMRYTAAIALRERIDERKTSNPLQAAAWGVEETRDWITQAYLTLKRIAQRSVPASGVMGPVGIFQAGSKAAERGTDWLLWFLSMISANLAVVNFLPIPIVDGGLFLFLIIEKLQGRPISARTQSIAQVVGLALILSVFLFITYQDILRLR